MNPFEVLGVEARFDLDVRILEKKYRDLARRVHPDRYAQAPAGERRLALERAVSLNEAYAVLRDEVSRAEALLRALGRNYDPETTSRSDPDFLMKVMELREALSEARDAGDDARIAALAEDTAREEAAVRTSLTQAFESRDLFRAEREFGKLRYYARFREELDDIEEERATKG